MVISGKFWTLPCTEPGRRRTVCSKGYLSMNQGTSAVAHGYGMLWQTTRLMIGLVQVHIYIYIIIIIVSLQVSACVCVCIYIYYIHIQSYTYVSFSKDNLSKLASGHIRVSTLWLFFGGVEP